MQSNLLRTIISISFLMLSYSKSEAQNFVNPGAEWIFYTPNFGGGATYYQAWKLEGDTTINDSVAQKINVYETLFFIQPPTITYQYSNSFYLKVRNDSVFYSANASDFYMIYDFSETINNTWRVDQFNYNSAYPMIVKKVEQGYDTINENPVKWIRIESMNSDSIWSYGKIYYHFVGPSPIYPLVTWNQLHWGPIGPICYHDDVLGYVYNNGGFCQDIAIVALPNIENKPRFTIYPNPTNDLLNVQFNDLFSGSLLICDISGRLLESKELKSINTTCISLADYAQGVYFVTVAGNNNERQTLKLVKQ